MTRLRHEIVDRVLDVFEQLGILKDVTLCQQLQTPEDLCQQLLSRLPFVLDHRTNRLEEAYKLVRIGLWIGLLEKVLQVLACVTAALDVVSGLNPFFIGGLVVFTLVVGIFEDLDQGR